MLILVYMAWIYMYVHARQLAHDACTYRYIKTRTVHTLRKKTTQRHEMLTFCRIPYKIKFKIKIMKSTSYYFHAKMNMKKHICH